MKLLSSGVSYQKSLIYLLMSLSILVLFTPQPTNCKAFNSNNAFGDYLGLITGLAGVIITVTIFLIQNNTKDYSSQLLRITFFKNWIFSFIIFYIFFSLSVFIYGSTFIISQDLKFFGFLLGMGLILNFIALLISAAYNMNILNTIKEIEKNITRYIRFKADVKQLPYIGAIGLNESSSKEIVNRLVPIFDTLKKSVSLNQNDVSDQCLSSIQNIMMFYLKKTKTFRTIEDRILFEISDQISFVVEEMIESKNQKFMEKIPILLGNIGEAVLEYRHSIGGINDHAVPFSRLLVKIFIKCYKFDRTLASRASIDSIIKLITKSIHKEYFQSCGIYYHDLKEMIELCLKIPNHWSSQLIVQCLHGHVKLINECIITTLNKKNVELHFFENLFSDIFKTIKEANNGFSHYHYDIIFRSVFNLHSVLVVASKVEPLLPVYKKIPDSLMNPLVDNYTNLCSNILSNRDIEIDFMFLPILPEFLFFTHNLYETKDRFYDNHKKIFLVFLKRLKIELEKQNDTNYFDYTHYCSSIEDYFAIMVFSKYTDLIEFQIETLVNFYLEVKSSKRVTSGDKHVLYRLLKNIGAFMQGEKEVNKHKLRIKKALIEDFIEPNFSRFKGIPSFWESHDYGNFKHNHEEWYIHPISIWEFQFQEDISKFINKNDLDKFKKFHGELKKAHNQ